MAKAVHQPDAAATPVVEIETADSGPGLRIKHQAASANAIEIVGPDGTVLSSVNSNGGPGIIPKGALERRLVRPSGSQVVTTFQSGHGWTSSVGAGSPVFTLNDTTDFVLGSQAVKIDCPINAAGYVSKTGLSINSTGKVPRLWVKVDNLSTVFSLVFYLGDAGFANFWQWNVWQSGSTQFALDGEWVIITLNWSDATATGSPNRAAITDARLRLNGGPSSQSALHVNAVEFVSQLSTAWPNGVVTLRFDDGWGSQFTEAKKKMDQYLFPGTAYPIVDQVGAAGFMTLAQLQQLEALSGWEIGSHAYSLAAHNNPLGSLDAATVEREFAAMRRWNSSNGFSGGAHFAWPLGVWTTDTMPLAQRYFASAMSIYEKHQETLPVADRHRLRIRNVQNTTTTGSLQTDIDAAFANGEWLILMFHKIVTSPAVSTEYSIANFGTVIDYLNTKGIPVRTTGDVLATH